MTNPKVPAPPPQPDPRSAPSSGSGNSLRLSPGTDHFAPRAKTSSRSRLSEAPRTSDGSDQELPQLTTLKAPEPKGSAWEGQAPAPAATPQDHQVSPEVMALPGVIIPHSNGANSVGRPKPMGEVPAHGVGLHSFAPQTETESRPPAAEPAGSGLPFKPSRSDPPNKGAAPSAMHVQTPSASSLDELPPRQMLGSVIFRRKAPSPAQDISGVAAMIEQIARYTAASVGITADPIKSRIDIESAEEVNTLKRQVAVPPAPPRRLVILRPAGRFVHTMELERRYLHPRFRIVR